MRKPSVVVGLGRYAWAALLVAFVAWSSWFIYRTSFEIEGTRYFSLFDDAMISASYAQNLVAGRGLRWDGAEEPVEGFTNPLWTLVMVAMFPPGLPVRYGSLVLQLLSLGFLCLNLVLVRRLGIRHFGGHAERPHTWLPACVLTAAFYPLSYWALMGLETGLQACLATAGTLLALDVLGGRHECLVPLGGVLTLAYLTRMDMTLWILFVAAMVSWRRPEVLRSRRFWTGAALLAVGAAGYQAFRMAYFGDILPNPYYLKMTGIPLDVRLARGALVTSTGLGLAPLLLLPVLAAALRQPSRRTSLALVALPFLIYAAYSVWVGGDSWERAGIGANRFLAWTIPLLFVALFGSWNLLARRSSRSGGSRTAAIATVFVLAAVAFVPGRSVRDRISDLLVLRPPYQVTSHAGVLRDFLTLQRLFPEEHSVTTVFAGIPAVYTDFRLIDYLGYTDRWLAKQPPSFDLQAIDPEHYEPGHVKWNLETLLRRHRPDIVFQTFGLPPQEAIARLRHHGYRGVGGVWLAPWMDSPDAP